MAESGDVRTAGEKSTLSDLLVLLESWYPRGLAESWDNVGLLLGDPAQPVQRIMTCLTLTAPVADEAMAKKADLIVTHHPIFFKPVKRLTARGSDGFLYHLARAGVAVYSPHTAFDSAAEGINLQLATKLGLEGTVPLRPLEDASNGASREGAAEAALGAGRMGTLTRPASLEELASRLAKTLHQDWVQFVGDPARVSSQVAIGCGAAGDFLRDAQRKGCDTFVTGEMRFHDMLAAQSLDMGVILLGHYASERFALESMAERLQQTLREVEVWSSQAEADPLQVRFVK